MGQIDWAVTAGELASALVAFCVAHGLLPCFFDRWIRIADLINWISLLFARSRAASCPCGVEFSLIMASLHSLCATAHCGAIPWARLRGSVRPSSMRMTAATTQSPQTFSAEAALGLGRCPVAQPPRNNAATTSFGHLHMPNPVYMLLGCTGGMLAGAGRGQ